MSTTTRASASLTISLRFSTSYPSGGMPPIHRPFFFDAATLSRTLSLMTSRSNWAKDKSTFSVSRPMLVVVLNCWVIDTKETPQRSKTSTSLHEPLDIARRDTHSDGLRAIAPHQRYRDVVALSPAFLRGMGRRHPVTVAIDDEVCQQ